MSGSVGATACSSSSLKKSASMDSLLDSQASSSQTINISVSLAEPEESVRQAEASALFFLVPPKSYPLASPQSGDLVSLLQKRGSNSGTIAPISPGLHNRLTKSISGIYI